MPISRALHCTLAPANDERARAGRRFEIGDRIAILSPVIAAHDAVGNDVLGMRSVLSNAGADVRLFAETVVGVDVPVSPLRELPEFCNSPDSLLIYHFSVGWAPGLDVVSQVPARRILKYHNVTPPEFFAPHCAEYAAVCQAGRDQIGRVAKMPFTRFWGDSGYNVAELVREGAPAERTSVIPPFHHIADLLEADADLKILDQYRGDSFNVLMVGRIAPNKGHPRLVRAFADFRTRYRADARLIIVGSSDIRLASYEEEILKIIEAERIADSVAFLGGIPLHHLKAVYLCTDVFMTMSEHEGFCVPVVEAMALGIPVVAFGSSAIPETVGPAGIFWDESDPLYYSETLRKLADNDDLRETFAIAGSRRFEQEFREDRISQALLREIDRAESNA